MERPVERCRIRLFCLTVPLKPVRCPVILFAVAGEYNLVLIPFTCKDMEFIGEIGIEPVKIPRALCIRISERYSGESFIGPWAWYLDHIDLTVKREFLIVISSLIITFRRHETDIAQQALSLGNLKSYDKLTVGEFLFAERCEPSGQISHLAGIVCRNLGSYAETAVFYVNAVIAAIFLTFTWIPSGCACLGTPDCIIYRMTVKLFGPDNMISVRQRDFITHSMIQNRLTVICRRPMHQHYRCRGPLHTYSNRRHWLQRLWKYL